MAESSSAEAADPPPRPLRILIIGAGGMMGHMACRVLAAGHEVFGTVRGEWSPTAPLAAFLPRDRWVPHVDLARIDTVARALEAVRPDAVVNCAGVVKQLEGASDPILSIETNALFPHRLAMLCRLARSRLVHMSTDCVFSGRRGMYTEDDTPDPVDLYGRSKLLGETAADEGLTIRTSIVGRQLTGTTSLFEWVLANRGGTIRGFDRAVYSGLTTMALTTIIERILTGHPDLSGVWQVASDPITKYALLQMLDERLGLGIEIERDDTFACDRSLDGSAFVARTGIRTPSWDEMLDEFRDDQAVYEKVVPERGTRP